MDNDQPITPYERPLSDREKEALRRCTKAGPVPVINLIVLATVGKESGDVLRISAVREAQRHGVDLPCGQG